MKREAKFIFASQLNISGTKNRSNERKNTLINEKSVSTDLHLFLRCSLLLSPHLTQ